MRARVRVVRDPRETLRRGEILVAERTDPSWVVLFPAAAAILVERGSQLSHAAIVSREMGDSVGRRGPRADSWLRDGDLVELDGATGVVRRLERGVMNALRYAQCWEDADVLVAALAVRPGGTYVAIASAGDNALAMLAAGPARVIALDREPAQLAALALRVAAYRALTHEELLALVGSRPHADRLALYARCRPLLDDAARAYWDARRDAIRAGIGGAGPLRALPRAVSHRRAAADPFERTVRELLACDGRRRARALLRRALGHAALAARLPRVLRAAAR